MSFAITSGLLASDHADPIDLLRWRPLEPVITDLFVFPVDKAGSVVHPFQRADGISLRNPERGLRDELTPEQREDINALIVILCVRRALTDSQSLNLEPFTYQIHMDTRSKVGFSDRPAPGQTADAPGGGYRTAGRNVERPTGEEARARYGGLIGQPESIEDDVLIQIRLKNDATLNDFRILRGLSNAHDEHNYVLGKLDPESISVWTGIRDDPFIFPAFFQTNVVAMVVQIPVSCFKAGQRDWLIWGTSHKGRRQIDHVGRSLRTQNPRFELLNTLPPSRHVEAIQEEHENPSLMRDLFLRSNIQSLFAFREWDFVPDVMIYTTRYPVGFPNGRLLEDDVAALLAQHGDTLLLELSHHNANWPRRTANDKKFQKDFPYLAEPWPDREPPEPYQLSWRNRLILAGLGVFALLVLVLAAMHVWELARRWLGVPRRSGRVS